MTVVQFREKMRWADKLSNDSLISACVASDGSAVLLVVAAGDNDKPFARDLNPTGASVAAPTAEAPYSAALINIGDIDYCQRVEIQTTHTFPKVERFSDGRYLVVGARCQITSSNSGDSNASIYGAGGDLDAQFCLGDAIHQVCVTPNGNIWIGYFDEGIFGNYEIAQSGIACFNDRGENLWRYTPPSQFDTPADCYALGANGDDIWSCYYTDFPVVQISSDFSVKGWPNKVSGANKITVSQQKCLLFGGYGENSNKCTIQTFTGNELTDQVDVKLVLPANQNLAEAQVSTRDGRIYAMTNLAWYELWLDEIL